LWLRAVSIAKGWCGDSVRSGDNTRIAVDSDRGVAAIAGGGAGLHLVNVANPAAPVLIRDVMFSSSVVSVAMRDGIAYAVAGSRLLAVDINTGDVRTELTPGGVLVDVAIEGDVIYTLNNVGVVRAIAIIELWAAPERHRSARLAPVTGTPLLRRARPARGAERTIDPSGGHSPAVQRAHLMWLCLPQDLRHTSTAHLARTPCVAEPGYLIELCSQRSRTYPHTGHPHGHPQTGSDNRV
jgi:hypothetical protein